MIMILVHDALIPLFVFLKTLLLRFYKTNVDGLNLMPFLNRVVIHQRPNRVAFKHGLAA